MPQHLLPKKEKCRIKAAHGQVPRSEIARLLAARGHVAGKAFVGFFTCIHPCPMLYSRVNRNLRTRRC